MLKSVWIAAAVLVTGATMALAGEPSADRQLLMKNVGAAAGAGGAILKGETEFEPRVADLAFRVMHQASLTFGGMFPEGSETGNETEAAPKIWEDMEGFQARLADFRTDIEAAIESKPQDKESFQQAFANVTENCKGCHENYRIEKK